MPPVGPLWNIDWLNANSQRNFPLSDVATRKDASGDFTLPNDFLVDLVWPVQADVTIDPSLFHVAAVGIFGGGVTLALGYNGTVIGNVSIPSAGFAPFNSYYIAGTGNFFDSVGKVVIGSLTAIMQNSGAYTFTLSGGRLEPSVIRPDLRGVSALYVKNIDEVSDAIQGDIILEAGTNFKVEMMPAEPGEPARIRLSAINGEGLDQACSCNENTDLPAIKSINGVFPDLRGRVNLLGDDCIKVTGAANSVKLEDDCSKPCCGCEELNVVTAALANVLSQVVSLENLAYRLETNLNALQTNLIASKVGSTV